MNARTPSLSLAETLVSVWGQVFVEGQSEVTLGRRRRIDADRT
jgi:hypothetical protein